MVMPFGAPADFRVVSSASRASSSAFFAKILFSASSDRRVILSRADFKVVSSTLVALALRATFPTARLSASRSPRTSPRITPTWSRAAWSCSMVHACSSFMAWRPSTFIFAASRSWARRTTNSGNVSSARAPNFSRRTLAPRSSACSIPFRWSMVERRLTASACALLMMPAWRPFVPSSALLRTFISSRIVGTCWMTETNPLNVNASPAVIMLSASMTRCIPESIFTSLPPPRIGSRSAPASLSASGSAGEELCTPQSRPSRRPSGS